MNYGAGNSFARGAATGFQIIGGLLNLLERGKKSRGAAAGAAVTGGGGWTTTTGRKKKRKHTKVHIRPMIPTDKGKTSTAAQQGAAQPVTDEEQPQKRKIPEEYITRDEKGEITAYHDDKGNQITQHDLDRKLFGRPDAIKLEIPPEQGGTTYTKVKGINNSSLTAGQARAIKTNYSAVKQNNEASLAAQKAALIQKGLILDNKLKQAKVDGIPNRKLQNEYDTTKKRYEMLLAKKKLNATSFDTEVKKEKKKQEEFKTKTEKNKAAASENQVSTSKFKAKKAEQDYLKSLKKIEGEGKLKFNDGTPTTVDQLIKMYNAGDRETSLQEFINKTTGHNLFSNPRQKSAGNGKFTTFITPEQRALASRYLKQGSRRQGSRGDVLDFIPKP